MKKLLLLSILLISLPGTAQNLVPNPSFEDTLACPQGPDELFKAVSWSSYSGTPDYYNACAPDGPGSMSVPYNVGWYQPAASGSAYAGLLTYSNFNGQFRELIGSQLTSALTVGNKYYVSFKVALTLSSSMPVNCASNKMGAMFSMIPYNLGNSLLITNAPPVYANSIITDSTNWSTIFGSFTADSAYQYIILGNFFDNLNTDILKYYDLPDFDFAYYFFDDICVSTDSSYAFNYPYTGILEKEIDQFNIYPNPATDYVTLSTARLNNKYSVKIYDALGKILIRSENVSEKSLKIDLSPASKGLLFINITSEDFNLNYKLLKQ